MKNKIFGLILVIILLLNTNNVAAYMYTDQYEVGRNENIEEIMNVLCSDEYRGRVVATEENLKTAEFIKNYFNKLELSPFDKDNFYIETGLRYRGKEQFEINNVAAIIKGKSSETPVFLTAHFDHIENEKGEKLMGAIDNASGVSVVLETARKLKEASKDKLPDNDVIIVMYNAEETGLNGSNEFMKKYGDKYKNCYNINIDCVGVKDCFELAMGNNDVKSEPLYIAMRNIFDEEGVKYNSNIYATKNGVIRGTSDHQIFRMYGHPSIVIGDDNIFDIVHSERDNLDNIDFSDLEKLSEVLCKFIYESRYKLDGIGTGNEISSSYFLKL